MIRVVCARCFDFSKDERRPYKGDGTQFSIFIEMLSTIRLNQDYVENSFGYIRQQGGNALGPQFSRALTKFIGLSFFHHSGNTNCESDSFQSLNLFSK